MDIKVRSIGGKYQEAEVYVDGHTLTTGTIDAKESVELAQAFIEAANELLAGAGTYLVTKDFN